MSACPWCKAEVSDPRFPCRGCGRRPKDHVSQMMSRVVETSAPLSQRRDPRAEPDEVPIPRTGPELHVPSVEPVAPLLDIPDLVVAPPRRVSASASSLPVAATPAPAALSLETNKPPSFAPPPPKPAPKKPMAEAGSFSFDDGLELTSSEGSLELGGRMGGESGAASADAIPEPPAAPLAVSAPAPPVPGALLRGGSAPAATADTTRDAREAAERLGDYGDVPSAWWMAPVYAYRVKMRQMELGRELVERRAALEKARGAGDDVLVVLASRGRKHIEHNDEYVSLFKALSSAEAALRQRDSALAAETDAHTQKTSGLDEQISRHEAETAGARAEEKAAIEHFERVDGVRQRADAKVKRAEIELRGAVARAGPPPSRSGLPKSADIGIDDPEVAAKTAERDARLAELEQAMPAVTEATQQLTVARRSVNAVQQEILAVKNQRALLEDQWKRRGAAHGAEVEKAEKAVRAAMATLGRAIAGDNSTFGPEWDETRAEIQALDKTTRAADADVALYVMALDAHDRPTAQKGLAVVLGGFALLIVLCLVPVVLTMGGGKPRPAPPPGAIDID